MRFVFVTLFPHLMEGYFGDSILSRGIEAGAFEVEYRNPREMSADKWGRTDDTAAGGGAGMVMTPQPLFDTLRELKREYPGARVIFVTPAAPQFCQNDAVRLARCETVILVSGRYEGIDERVIETFADEVLSIGDYILTGGELASLVICDAVVRNLAGVLGNSESLDQESFNEPMLEAPSFGKPALYSGMDVPSVLLKGNHSKIALLKKELSLAKTQYFRPDLFENYRLRTHQ